MFYSGIDQHKRDSFITTYDDGGPIVNQEGVPNTPLRVQRYFAQFPPTERCVGHSEPVSSPHNRSPSKARSHRKASVLVHPTP